MALKFFSKIRKRKAEAEPLEMEPLPEDEGEGLRLEPGQPAPYHVPSWLPPGKESYYQRGSAVVATPDKVVLDDRLRAPRDERVHVVRPPPAGPVSQATHGCLNCGFLFKVPYRRPVQVTCPDCGAEDELR